ncbi:MAG: ABC transporter permease [Actinomycetota bacterium]|nr:ABC transporter permease [Actinomycetota bacterium]
MTASLDLSPAPGAAPPRQRVLAQARGEIDVLMRNLEQLLVAVALPALVLVGLVEADSPDLGSAPRVDVLTPGVLALALISSAFTGQAIQTGFDRRYGVLRMLGSTPLGRSGLLAAKAIAALTVIGVQVVLLGGLGLALGWRPRPLGLLPAIVLLVVGAAAFVALGLLVAGTMRAEAVLAVANLVWVLLLAGSAVVVPASVMPAPLDAIAKYLPSGALGEGLRAALQHGRLAVVPLVVLLGWLAAAAALVARTFRWS